MQSAECRVKEEQPTPARHFFFRSALCTLHSALLLLAGWLFLAGLGERELYSSHEARAAQDVAGLLASGDGVPRLFDGRADTQKPPLYYWLAALFAWAGCPPEWAVRLPAALAGLGVVALVLFAGARLGRPWAGVFAAAVLVGSIHFPWLARIGRIDMPLAFTTTAAGLAFLLALRGERGWLIAAWLACAAGVLLKGPIGLALPASIVAALLLAEGRWPAVWEGRAWLGVLGEVGFWWGVPLVLALTVPVFAWLHLRTGGAFTEEFFWLHNVARGLGGSRLRAHVWWLYGPYLMLYLLPFSPLLLAALWRPMWRDGLARAGLAWMCGAVLLLSAAKFKRADYLLPVYPGAALFVGCLLERWMRSRPRLVLWGAGLALAGAVAAWGVYLHVRLPAERGYRDYRPLAGVIHREGGEVVFFRAEAHALMYRVGRPSPLLVEWRELREAVGIGPTLVVLPPQALADAVREMPGIRLERVSGTAELAGGRHERPLLLVRAIRDTNHHAAGPRAAEDPRRPPGRAAPGP